MKKIALIFNKERTDTVGIYFEKALQGLPYEVDHFWTERAHEISSRYDVYLRIDHGDYKYDVPVGLYPKVFYVIDTHLKKPFKKLRRQLWHYDIVICAQKEGAERLSHALKRKCFWVPLGCDPDIHRAHHIPKTLDIAFVGTFGKKGSRPAILRMLHKRFPNSFIGQAPHTEMSKLYGSAKIGFNYSLSNDINMRIFEVLSSGTLLLTNKISGNGFDELFKEGTHLITYSGLPNLLRSVEYYLKNASEREHIARSGHEECLAHHTYRIRVQAILDIIERQLQWKRPVIL